MSGPLACPTADGGVYHERALDMGNRSECMAVGGLIKMANLALDLAEPRHHIRITARRGDETIGIIVVRSSGDAAVQESGARAVLESLRETEGR